MGMDDSELSLRNMNLIFPGFWEDIELVEQEMYLAKGLGIGGGGGDGWRDGGGGEFNPAGYAGDGRNNQEVKMMVQENPGNPLILRNHAQFLYQSKRDLHGAEEYYARAILTDPEDGEILSQYANIVWELHHDQQRASSYFQRAVKASPEDSHVHAAYAKFLWETEEDEDEENESQDLDTLQPIFKDGAKFPMLVL